MAARAGRRVRWCAGKFYQGLTEALLEYAKAQFKKEEDKEELPEQIGYLWHWFNDLTDWRVVGDSINALSHQEIEAWARLFQIDISPFEVDVLRKIDRIFRLHIRDELEEEEPKPIGIQIRDAVNNHG